MALFQLPTPPEGLSLKEYFENWLPGQLGEISPVLKENAPDIKFGISFKAEGEEGGEWTILVKEGEIKTEPGLSEGANLCIILPAKGLQEVIMGRRPLFMGMRRGGAGAGEIKPEKMVKQFKKMTETLKEIQGMVEFKLTGGEEFWARINFGPLQEEPTVSISISESDFQAMQKGELDPQTAFMSGKVQISGDLSFLFKLAPLMM